jgi:hypothetical protein
MSMYSMVMCYLWSVICCMDPNQFAPNMYDVQSSAAAQWAGVVVTLYMYSGDAWPKSHPSHWLCWVKFSMLFSSLIRQMLVQYVNQEKIGPLWPPPNSYTIAEPCRITQKSLSYSVCFLIYWQFFPSHLMSHSTCLNCPVWVVTCFNL